jgi:phosphate-selective porin OprO/OprP
MGLASTHSFFGGADDSCLCDDDKPLIRLKTRIFFDNVWSTDYAGAVNSSLDHSRFSVDDTRIGIEGWLRDDLYYRAEIGFVRSEPTRFSFADNVDMGDVFVELMDTAVGNVRFGHFVEPFSLERQSRKELLPFMERSVATRNFSPGRNLGVMLYNDLPNHENLSWFVGAFRGNKRDDFANSTSNDWTATGRVAWLAHYNECDHQLLHIGFGATARRTGTAVAEEGNGLWTGRVPLGDLSSLIEIQVNPNSEFNVYNIELAWAKGPLTLQAEGYHAETNGQRLYMTGAYAQVSYFLYG